MELWDRYCQHERLVDFRAEVERVLVAMEKKHGVRIVVAADTGSRSCNLHSFGSDLDVHVVFVYQRPQKYLAVNAPRETLEYQGEFRLPPLEGLDDGRHRIEINVSGWDLRKASTLLVDSNAAMVDLLLLSQSPELGYRRDLNPFAGLLDECLFSFRRLGMHNRSTSANVYHNKIKSATGEVPVKCYLNLLRYVNLAEQIKRMMEGTGAESLRFHAISATGYEALPAELQSFQRTLLEQRRSAVWNVPRNEELERVVVGLLEAQMAYFAAPREDGHQTAAARLQLKRAVDRVCVRTLRDLILRAAQDGSAGSEGEEDGPDDK